MGKRRKARELALQFLFQLDMNPPGGAVNHGAVGNRSNEANASSSNETVPAPDMVTEIVSEEVTETVIEKVSKDVIKRVTKIVNEIDSEDVPEKVSKIDTEIVTEIISENVPENAVFENNTPNNIEMMMDNFWESFKTDSDLRPFFVELIEGVIKNREIIDKQINEISQNWKLNRMSLVDRNILRFSIFELMFADDIPPNVTMNEAIEIAKRYGTNESPSFINGILDKVANRLPKS